MQPAVEAGDDLARQYRFFTLDAADSPTFKDWAGRVAEDAEVQAWLATLPPAKRQPNLVFAAARWHGVPAPGPYAALRDALLHDDAPAGEGRIRATILERATQTNEVGRLATLVPAFALVGAADQRGRPLSLLEVGASAGLNLYPDRWGYHWRTDDGDVGLGPEPRLECRVKGPHRLPATVPPIAWRGGIDLNPLDVDDDDAMAWLTNLVWPEHDDRRNRLRHAIEVARVEPPTIVRGDLLDALPGVIEEAAAYGPVVVFHSAVIAYLEAADRTRFAEMMTGLVREGACHWVSNEGKAVLPSVTATGPGIPEDKATFVLGVDGQAVAWTHGHGRSMTWF